MSVCTYTYGCVYVSQKDVFGITLFPFSISFFGVKETRRLQKNRDDLLHSTLGFLEGLDQSK